MSAFHALRTLPARASSRSGKRGGTDGAAYVDLLACPRCGPAAVLFRPALIESLYGIPSTGSSGVL